MYWYYVSKSNCLETKQKIENQRRSRAIEAETKRYFSLKIDVATTMRKYFKTIYKYQDIDTNKNISFFNFRAEKINKILQSRMPIPKDHIMNDKLAFYKGLELICPSW